jgi:hypothetical protein
MNTLKATEIENIFNDHILINKNFDYANRYKKLPINFNNKSWKWEGMDFPRIIALLEFNRLMQKHQIYSENILTFNGQNDPELTYIKWNNHHNFNYFDDPDNYDLHTLHIPKGAYDFVMLNQTLEHLYNPFIVLDNIYNLVEDGAYVYANVPSVNIAHDTPIHFYTGFTPIGLGCVFKSCGFEILEIGQWGNLEYINKMYKTQGWPDYRALKDYSNDFNNPVITWILAKK